MSEESDRFALFAWPAFDEGGGWHDFRSRHGTVEEAVTAAKALEAAGYDCWHVIDLDTNEIVRESE